MDCNPELGTLWLSAADAFPLSVNLDTKFINGKRGERTKLENLLQRGNQRGRTRNECRRRMTGKHDLCQSKKMLSRNHSINLNRRIYQVPV